MLILSHGVRSLCLAMMTLGHDAHCACYEDVVVCCVE